MKRRALPSTRARSVAPPRALALAAALAGSALFACKSSSPVTPPPTASVDGGAPIVDAGPTTPTPVAGVPVGAIPGHDALAQDVSPKEGPRLLPPEALIRSYLSIFGGLSPLDLQTRARQMGGNLFDTWNDYLASVGLPDYRVDIPRNGQASPIMLATFERIGVALCDLALIGDLRGTTPAGARKVFAFELTMAAPTDAELDARLDVLHRTFLGYPLALAPAERAPRLRGLYRTASARRAAPVDAGIARGNFNPAETGWASVCYALVRHPEFHLY